MTLREVAEQTELSVPTVMAAYRAQARRWMPFGSGVGSADPATDLRPHAGSVQARFRVVESCGRRPSDQRSVRFEPAGPDGRGIAATLGIHAIEADQEGLRTAPCRSEAVAGSDLSPDCCSGQGRGRRDSLGRRNRTALQRRARPWLCPLWARRRLSG